MSTNVLTLSKPSKAWSIGLWVAQVLVALMFGMAGFMKATTPIEVLATNMPWVTSMPALVRVIGIAELLGAIGLILPAATRILPILTPAAGGSLVVVMILAAIFHGMRAEFAAIVPNLVLGLLAGLVTWGRLSKAPIAPRK